LLLLPNLLKFTINTIPNKIKHSLLYSGILIMIIISFMMLIS